MPHFLCFTDLTVAKNNSTISHSAEKNSSAADDDVDSSSQAIGMSAPSATEAPSEIGRHPTALLVREGNKKSSFLLEQPFALFYASGTKFHDGNNGEVHGYQATDEQIWAQNDMNIEQPDARGDEKSAALATASITSCMSSEPPQFALPARETFLFGGFELIANVKTIEVYVSRGPTPGEESYLTTCKGIPMRDLPHLASTPQYIDGTKAEEESTHIDNDDGISALSEGVTKTDERDTFYKFILVSPGGPKPQDGVRLKFVRSNASVHACPIIVRTLKVKGRLSDSIPTSSSSQQPTPQPSLPMGAANYFNPGIPNNGRRDNMNNLASMMAMMGGNGVAGMPTASQMNPQQLQQLQQLGMQSPPQQFVPQQQQQVNYLASMMGGNGVGGMPMAMQTSHQQQQLINQLDTQSSERFSLQQQENHQREKNQAEIISSVAGLGMFLKSSEERAMNRIESLLINMEMRIMTRLDGLAERLDAIGQNVIDDASDELSSQE